MLCHHLLRHELRLEEDAVEGAVQAGVLVTLRPVAEHGDVPVRPYLITTQPADRQARHSKAKQTPQSVSAREGRGEGYMGWQPPGLQPTDKECQENPVTAEK